MRTHVPVSSLLAGLGAGFAAFAAILSTIPTIRSLRSVRAQAPTAALDTVKELPSLVIGGMRYGSGNPRVSIVVFNDYQCPACRSLSRRLFSFLESRSDVMSIILRQAPLPTHHWGRAAGRAAVCVRDPDAHRRFHEVLLEKAESLGGRSWTAYAREAEIQDTAALAACLRSSYPDSMMQGDAALASRLGVTVAPTFFVNGEMYDGVPWDLERIIARQIRR